MKNISQHLGEIIIALAAVALLIMCVTVFRTDIGAFFDSVIDKEQAVGEDVLGKLDGLDFDLSGDYTGPTITVDSELGTDRTNPLAVESASFVLSGTAIDKKSGVASLTVNGNPVSVEADGSWSTTLVLTMNEVMEVVIEAKDNKGNTSKKAGYVVYVTYSNIALSSDYFDEIGYDTTVTDLVIPATFQDASGNWYKVTSIYGSAFKDHTNLTSVEIPDSVTQIYVNAFNGCTSLTNVTFGENSNLAAIENSVFENCTSLTSVTIPNSVWLLGESAFYKCTSLTSVSFGENIQLTSIKNYTFRGCTNLTNVTIPDSVTSIGTWAFYKCTSLTSITFEGTSTEWAVISLGSDWSYKVPAKNVYCMGDGVTVSLS